MKSDRFTRRSLLAKVGGSLALLPVLEADRLARAAAAPPTKRLVIMQWADGIIHNAFWPKEKDERAWTLNTVTSPLQSVKDDVILVAGLDLRAMRDDKKFPGFGGHTSLPYLLTGAIAKAGPGSDGNPTWPAANGISIDQHVANAIAARTPTAIKSLELGAVYLESKTNMKAISYRGPAIGTEPNAMSQENKPEVNPYKVYMRLFAGRDTGGTDAQAQALARLRKEKRSILDAVGTDLESLATNLGRDDRMKVQQHLESVRRIEQQLDGVPGAAVACQTPPAVAAGLPTAERDSYGSLDKLLRVQLDLMVAAMRCDVTRVATIMGVNGHNGSVKVDFLGSEFAAFDHHRLSHDSGDGGGDALAVRGKNLIDQWFVKQFATIAEAFKNTPEGSGTMLDNSLLVLCNNFSRGASHSYDGTPFVLAGRAGGYLKTGRYLRYGDWGTSRFDGGSKTVPHNGLLVAIANAMDAPVETFGDAQYGGELPNIRGS